MAKRKSSSISMFTRKNLGLMVFAGLIIQFVFPAINLGSLSWIATLLYLIVGLVLFLG